MSTKRVSEMTDKEIRDMASVPGEREVLDVRWLIQIKGFDGVWFYYNRHGHDSREAAAMRATEVADGSETRLVRMTREVEHS